MSLWVKSSDLISWARTLNGPLTFGPTGDRFETAAHAASLQSPYASYWDSWAHPPSTISGPMTKTVGVRGFVLSGKGYAHGDAPERHRGTCTLFFIFWAVGRDCSPVPSECVQLADNLRLARHSTEIKKELSGAQQACSFLAQEYRRIDRERTLCRYPRREKT